MRWFVVSCALAVAGQFVSPAHADIAFADLVGDWTASGQVVAQPNAPLESSRCRVSVSSGNNGRTLTVQGRCAIAAGVAHVTMTVVDRQDGTIGGSVTLSTLEGAVQLAGSRHDDVISLTTQTAMLFEGQHYWSRLDITLNDTRQFSLKEWTAVQSTSDWQLTRDLLFQRQGGAR
ncbi:MAG: hypothetical protein AAF234_04150 [Pseudomonadota bacterium]